MRPSTLLRALILAAAVAACFIPARRAGAYYPEEHQTLTASSLFLLYEIYPETFDRCLALCGRDSVIRTMEYDNISYAPPKPSSTEGLIARIAWESVSPDFFKDLVWVDVDFSPDDPHTISILKNDDKAETSSKDDLFLGTMFAIAGSPHANFTSCNHFINIGTYGNSRFDDYDGYSYEFVKDEGHQYQTVKAMFGKALDEGINWYYGDSYVHAPGQKWYNGSSPSVERYSFPSRYPNSIEEFKDRFPMAKNVNAEGCGVPYSVFMPVDNMARYWFERFLATGDPLDLGPMLHAVCDAGIPHHAAGYVGNWHQHYETSLKDIVHGVLSSESDRARIKELVETWDRVDDNPPESLAPLDYRMTPAINWTVDILTTWMALHAYRQYVELYEPYYRTSGAGIIIPEQAREMVILGTAMNVIVLKKALTEYVPH